MSTEYFHHIRQACQEVAEQAQWIQINREYLPAYARTLPRITGHPAMHDATCHFLNQGPATVAFFVILDSINFGSGFFPHLKKRVGKSGYFTVAAALNDYFKYQGPFSAPTLAALTRVDCYRIFEQSPENPVIDELLGWFSQALNDLGNFLLTKFNGDFVALIQSAQNSAGKLIEQLTPMPRFQDVAQYHALTVPFYKRAQLMAADLALAFQNTGYGYFRDLDQLTIFADNLVPHVLRVDRVLLYKEELIRRIEIGELIPAGSTEEIEIRACALHAVELIRQQLNQAGQPVTSMDLDYVLWNRGQLPSYKAIPRHRTRTVFY
ncbi:queuosine salvage family protein [candidate division KSB1 bacterium]|nr:queuosine salvage family protein [candidate division KSB1 bacterium]